MKAYPIEDTIIAYFDGRLNDADGAELLHRVSVSPEIRGIFEEHDALRRLAVRAAHNSAISPELEEAVFARVAALQEEERLPIGFWTPRRVSAMAGVVAILLVGIAGSFEFQNAGASSAQGSNFMNRVISIQHDVTSSRFENVQQSERPSDPAYRMITERVNSEIPGDKISGDNVGKENDISPSAIMMRPAPAESEVARISLPSIGHGTLQSLRDLSTADGESKFETAISSSPMSGFSIPGSAPQQGSFSDVTLRAAYNLDEKNQVGVRFTDGAFAGLQSVSGVGYSHVTMLLQHGYAEELFYRHREAVENGLFFVTGGAGGGIYSLGTLLSAELGIEVPFGDRLLGGVSLVVSRQHQNGSEAAFMSSSSVPVLYDGSNGFNTLAGRIEYALSYKF